MRLGFLSVRCLPRWFWPVCLVCFVGAAWVGWRLFRRPDSRQPQPRMVTLIFHVYDTKGAEMSRARLIGPTPQVLPQMVQGSDCQLTKPEGTTRELRFAHGARAQDEQIVWRSAAEFEGWLDAGLPAHLQQIDPSYDRQRWREIVRRIKGRARPTKYDYPIIFPASP